MAPHLSHSYTYRLPEEQQNTVEISLRFPRISSFRYHFSLSFKLRINMSMSLRWCLKLYCLVLAGLGLFLAGIWVIFQLYVLSQTTNQELRQQR